jgi:hypothetical protein
MISAGEYLAISADASLKEAVSLIKKFFLPRGRQAMHRPLHAAGL